MEKVREVERSARLGLPRERLRHIPEPSFSNLADAFDNAADGERRERLQNTGNLMVAAVYDEAAGVAEAVASLLPWLTDRKRFSPQWIAAVLRTLEQARELVKESGS